MPPTKAPQLFGWLCKSVNAFVCDNDVFYMTYVCIDLNGICKTVIFFYNTTAVFCCVVGSTSIDATGHGRAGSSSVAGRHALLPDPHSLPPGLHSLLPGLHSLPTGLHFLPPGLNSLPPALHSPPPGLKYVRRTDRSDFLINILLHY